MSGGGWSYNRFDEYEKKLAEAKASKDYDGDGKVESSKDEYFGSKDKAIKKAMGKTTCKKCDDDCDCNDKKEVKEGMGDIKYPKGPFNKFTKSAKDPNVAAGRKAAKAMGLKQNKMEEQSSCSSSGYQEGGEVKKPKKKVVKEDVIEYIMNEGLANNVVSADVLFNHISDEFLESIEEDIMEIYVGKHGQTEKEYQDGRSMAGKLISGDSKGSGANYSYKAKNTGPNPAGGSKRPQGQARMTNDDRAYLKLQKANMKNKD